MVAEVCRTPNPVTSTYAGVVSSESVRVAFTYTALNGLDVWEADVKTPLPTGSMIQKVLYSLWARVW